MQPLKWKRNVKWSLIYLKLKNYNENNQKPFVYLKTFDPDLQINPATTIQSFFTFIAAYHHEIHTNSCVLSSLIPPHLTAILLCICNSQHHWQPFALRVTPIFILVCVGLRGNDSFFSKHPSSNQAHQYVMCKTIQVFNWCVVLGGFFKFFCLMAVEFFNCSLHWILGRIDWIAAHHVQIFLIATMSR